MKKTGFPPYGYAVAFLVVILLILLENSYLLISQTRANLNETAWLEAERLINSIVAGAQLSIDAIQPSPQQINRHVRKIASLIDEIYRESLPHTEEAVQEILKHYKIDSILIMDPTGSPVRQLSRRIDLFGTDRPDNPKALLSPEENRSSIKESDDERALTTVDKHQNGRYQLTVDRVFGKGTIRLTFGAETLQEIRSRVGLQLLISFMEIQNVIQSATFLNDQLLIIADYEPSRIGTVEERLEYLESLINQAIFFNRRGDVMEIIHPLNLGLDNKGVFRVTFRMTGIEEIYGNAIKITIINSIAIMVLALAAAAIMIKRHQRYQQRMTAMERRIQENEKLTSLANLTAGVAHEVRNPLNSISITIQRLQLEFSPGKATDREEYQYLTTTLKREVDRINGIITDYLDFAKPFKPRYARFSVDGFLDETLGLFANEAKKKSVSIDTQSSTRHLFFFGDREKLTQVLINLLRNALDATPENGTITVSSELTSSNEWRLTITDTGVGIAKTDQNRIFDIYFTTKRDGTGLGLYVTRKIIQAHQGTIALHPGVERGTRAVVTLPCEGDWINNEKPT
jgi:signal transduction histidine kinase